jgi:tryptophan halogenase
LLESKTFVVVGGGTAGWLTALVANAAFKEHKVILVESADIGILGAGEGSTPHLVHFLDYVGIDLEDLVKNTSCTLKNGILFDNWSQNKKPYVHGFDVYDTRLQRIALNHGIPNFEWTSAPLLPYLSEYLGIEDEEIDFTTHISLKNKALFTYREDRPGFLENNGMRDFNLEGIYAVHFDAKSLADYLSRVAQERGVVRIEGKVEEIERESNGNISNLVLQDGERVFGDFFFDCTGFARLIIGKLFESEWVSFKDSLPAKRAMPFFLKPDPTSIPPYTLARAMDKGWIWKIPLQHRYGCGYVYDPDQISDEDVKKEIDSFVGEEVEVPRIFNFEPGYYKKVWIKNCLAVGLSNGFVEPLEATSIMQSVFALQTFFAQRHKIFSDDDVFKNNFNAQIEDDHQDVAAFIYLHYMTDKTNNDFWKNFTKHYKMPERLVPTIERAERGLLNMRDNSGIFDIVSFATVIRGNGMLNRKNVEEIYKYGIEDLNIVRIIDDIKANISEKSSPLVDHKALLSHLGGNFDQ